MAKAFTPGAVVSWPAPGVRRGGLRNGVSVVSDRTGSVDYIGVGESPALPVNDQPKHMAQHQWL